MAKTMSIKPAKVATEAASKIRFSATLLSPRRPTAKAVSRPSESQFTRRVGAWTLLTLPKEASGQLPSRGQMTVEGTLSGRPFTATLVPDGLPARRDSPKAIAALAASIGPGCMARASVALLSMTSQSDTRR